MAKFGQNRGLFPKLLKIISRAYVWTQYTRYLMRIWQNLKLVVYTLELIASKKTITGMCFYLTHKINGIFIGNGLYSKPRRLNTKYIFDPKLIKLLSRFLLKAYFTLNQFATKLFYFKATI